MQVPTAAGQLLLMPAQWGAHVGVKVASVSPSNPTLGLPRIQGLYVLLDSQTLSVVTVLDAAELTALRTAAVSALAVDCLASPSVESLALFGTGPQATSHLHAIRAIRAIRHVTVHGRTLERARHFLEEHELEGTAALVDDGATIDDEIIVCATGSPTPILADVSRVDAVVVAVGSHEPDRRELPGSLVSRSALYVDGLRNALTENGNIVMPVSEGAISPDMLVTLSSLVRGEAPRTGGHPALFLSSGMSWQDLVVATALSDVDIPESA